MGVSACGEGTAFGSLDGFGLQLANEEQSKYQQEIDHSAPRLPGSTPFTNRH